MDTISDGGKTPDSRLPIKVLQRLLTMAIAEGAVREDHPYLLFLSGSRADEVQELPLEGAARLGRQSDCEVVFDPYGDPMVSALHARICVSEEGVELQDMSSKNGTFLNGNRLYEAATLRSGDLLQLSADGPQIAYIASTRE